MNSSLNRPVCKYCEIEKQGFEQKHLYMCDTVAAVGIAPYGALLKGR